MELPAQPPPDVPAPPPGPEAIRSRGILKGLLLVGIVSVIFMLVGVVPSRVLFGTSNADRREAINNVKQVALALIDFDSDYGCFPDATTIAAVQADTSTSIPLGTSSSNALLRQLIANGNKHEKIFYAKSTVTPRKPDDIIHGSQALKKGECAFAYVAGLSSADDPTTPVLMAPVDPARGRFERREDYNNKAVILFLDGSARFFPVDKHGHVQLNGMDLFDPRQPFWKGKSPDIKWPE